MTPALQNLDCQQGDSFDQDLLLYQDTETGPLFDLTGYSARMQIRSMLQSPDVLLELSTANGKITLGGATGTISLALSAAETRGLVALSDIDRAASCLAFGFPVVSNYVYDLEVTAPDGAVITLLRGFFVVTAEVTR